MAIKSLLLIALGAYALILALLAIFQRELLYHPASSYSHNLDTIEVQSDGERINIYVINPGRTSAVIYFGGNAEPVIFNQVPFSQHLSNHTVYLVDYRGYGDSTGSPTERGLFADALSVYDKVSGEHQSVSVIGRSLGSGVAIHLATKRPINRLVLITPYDSIEKVAQKRMPIFPVSLILQDKYDSIRLASTISAPVLLLIAEHDQIIPGQHSRNLASAFQGAIVESVTVQGADHNNISSYPHFYRALADFLSPNFE